MSSQSYIFNPTERTLAAAGDGFSCPRLTTAGRTALSLTAGDKGMMVYDTTLNNLFIWNGSAWDSVPVGSFTVVDNIASLKSINVTGIANGEIIQTRGYYVDNDGGQGTYIYNSTSVATDNGGTVIAPTIGSGRYLLQVSDSVNVLQFGAKGDDVTDDSISINNAATYCRSSGKKLFIPLPSDSTKNYRTISQLDLRDLPFVWQDFDSFQNNQNIRSEFIGASVLIGGNVSVNAGGFYRLKVIRYPFDWAVGTIGVSVTKARSCDIEVSIQGFEKGLDVSPGSGSAAVYNRFKTIEVGYNKWNIYLGPTGNGYVISNQFYGGSLTLFHVNGGTPEANVGINTTSSSTVGDNVWREIDFAGSTQSFTSLTCAATFKFSSDGNIYGTQGNKVVNCRIEMAGANVRVPLVIINSTTNKRVVDIDLNFINNDFADYFPIIPENEIHYVRFSVQSMTRWLNESNVYAYSNESITPTGIEIPLYMDGSTIRGELRAPYRVIYDVSANSQILTIGSQSIGGSIFNTGLSASGEQNSAIVYNSSGTHYIVGQRYTKDTQKPAWIRVSDGIDMAVICFNAAGSILSGSSPYYAVGNRFRTQTNGGNGYYQLRGGWLWLHKDVSSFVIGYQSWLTAGFNPYRDLIIQSTAGTDTILSNPFGVRSVGIVTSGVPKSFWGVGTVATDVSGTARYQNSKSLETTLAQNTVFGSSEIRVVSAAGVAAGDTVGWQNGNPANGIPQWQVATVNSVDVVSVPNIINFAPTTIYANAVAGQRVRVNRWTTF